MKNFVEFSITAAVLVLSFSVASGYLLDRPVLLSYVTSDSMSPTINSYDLFLVNPIPEKYSEGDIIIFSSGGKWICHRVFAVLDGGYLTKGDNNIATDQLAGKDVVKQEDIAGKVVTFSEKPILLPGGGKLVGFAGTFLWENKILLLVVFIFFGLLSLTGGSLNVRRKRRYFRLKNSQVYTIITFSILLTVTFLSVFLITSTDINYGTTSAAGLRPEWVEPGKTFERTITVENKGIIPYYYYLTTNSKRVDVGEGFFLFPRESKNIRILINAPDATGIYSERIYICKYLPIAFPAMINVLAETSPFLPILLIDLELGVLMFLSYRLTESFEVYKMRNPFSRRFLQ
jgi:signal peptidase